MRNLMIMLLLLCAMPLAASGELPEGYWFEMIAKVFNFIVFFGFLFWLLRKPIAEMLDNSRRELKRKLAEAEEKEETAARRMKEIEDRMAGLETEVEEILRRTDEAARQEKENILERAKQEAEKIRLAAEREIENRYNTARRELQAFVADLAVDKAEELIRSQMTVQDLNRSMERYIEELKG